jgi:hypothetical protein
MGVSPSVVPKKKQVEEIIRCGRDPAYFFNSYCKIQHPTRGLLPFKTYPFQDDCVDQFRKNRFNIVVKSRQLGLSTITAAYAVWMALYQKEKNILVIATKLQVAQGFIRKVKTILNNMPPWLILPQITVNNKQQLEFSNGSSIKAIPTSDDAGRSESLTLLIIDEAAFVRNFDEIWTGIGPTLTTGGQAILLSTPNGVGGQFYKLYADAESGVNEFNPIKLPWTVHPEHDQAWFDKESKNYSERQIAQEFMCDFAASGDTFLTDSDISWVNGMIRPPVMRGGPDMNVWVWKIPLSEHRYILTGDVARGDSTDYSTFHIIDCMTGEVVAEYRGKMPPDRFAELISEWGIKYNKALVCPENNSYGYACLLRLKDLAYPKIYTQGSKSAFIGDYVQPVDLAQAGFATTGKTRSIILTKLEELIRNKLLVSYSSRFYQELKTFVWSNNSKAEAMKGHNDDLVMSLAIGAWLFDVNSEYSRTGVNVNTAMLSAMKRVALSSEALLPGHTPNIYTSTQLGANPRGDMRMVSDLKSGRIPQDMRWLFGR